MSLFVFILLAFASMNSFTTEIPNAEQLKNMTADERFASAALLRERGPQGLELVLKGLADDLRIALENPVDPDNQALLTYVDKVAAQRGAARSGLFWYTDLELAKRQSEVQGKPVLYLRLLGDLSKEFSCANSRFFRTVLYADPSVANAMQNGFILCWESERKIPLVNIDFQDGRTLRQTITGNSVHYVIGADGTVLDALPGLYGQTAYLQWLDRMSRLHRDWTAASGKNMDLLAAYHQERHQALNEDWQQKLSKLAKGTGLPARLAAAQPTPREMDGVPSFWQALGQLEKPEVLSLESWQVIDREMPKEQLTADQARARAMSKSAVETPLLRRLSQFSRTLGADTQYNENFLHSQIHARLWKKVFARNLELLNNWIYANLFLTPKTDPWLGLAPVDTYSGLENDGQQLAAQ